MLHWQSLIQSVADPGFPRGGCANSKGGCGKLLFGQFPPKTAWNGRYLKLPATTNQVFFFKNTPLIRWIGQNKNTSRMHSSRMRTVCLAGGVSAQGVYTSPRGQTDTCENIAFPQLLLRTVKFFTKSKVWTLNFLIRFRTYYNHTETLLMRTTSNSRNSCRTGFI